MLLQLNEAVPAAPDVLKIAVEPPSSRTVHVIVPIPLVSLRLTGTVPPTVAASLGATIDAVSGPATVTWRGSEVVEVPVLVSCSVTTSVCGPAPELLVIQSNDAVDALLVAVKTVLPSI